MIILRWVAAPVALPGICRPLRSRLALAALLIWSCAAADTVEVTVRNNTFQPATVKIKAGDSVHWNWVDGGHSSTSGSACTPNGAWNSGVQNAGFGQTVSFTQPGSFPYFCTPHCSFGMTGTVVVSAAAALAPSCSETDPVNLNPIPAAITKESVARAALQDVVSAGQGLVSPNWGVSPPGNRDRLFVTDTVGKLWAINLIDGSKNVVLDVSSLLVTDLGKEIASLPGYDERGLLGLAFHPRYARNGLIYTFTSEPFNAGSASDFPLHGLRSGAVPNHRNVISEWQVDDPRAAQPTVSGARRIIMRIDHPALNHNGGALNFGPDKLLYIALGDGGSANDQDGVGGHNPVTGNGQDLASVLGKILRIDPNRRSSSNGQYGVPRSNPFRARRSAGGDAGCADEVCDEIWAYGFRNPYRFSFDSRDGTLIAADVGQNKIEEVDVVKKRGNYGWRNKEGRFFFLPNGSDGSGTGFVSEGNCLGVPTRGLRDPVAQYDHDEGLAIVGGFVYRGSAIRALRGQYVFADYARSFGTAGASGRMFRIGGNLSTSARPRLKTIAELNFSGAASVGMSIFGLARDGRGELYVLGNTQGVPAPADPSNPAKFLETGIIRKLVRAP